MCPRAIRDWVREWPACFHTYSVRSMHTYLTPCLSVCLSVCLSNCLSIFSLSFCFSSFVPVCVCLSHVPTRNKWPLLLVHYNYVDETLLPFVLQPPASIFALSIRNIHWPGFPTLDLPPMNITWSVADPGMLKYLLPSPALNPAC